MLLVDDRQAQLLKLHLLLDDGVRAHHQRRLAACDGGQHLAARLLLLAAGEPGHALAARLQQRREPVDQLGEVLLGQDFGGRHQCALPAGVDGDAGRQRGHHRLAAAHVALQQAVHGLHAAQVARNLFAHAALRAGELERQHGQQLLVHAAALGAQHGRAQMLARPARFQLRQLLRQQLLGLQALPGGVAVVFQLGQRHIVRRLVQK